MPLRLDNHRRLHAVQAVQAAAMRAEAEGDEMSNSFMEMLVAKMNQPDPKPFLFCEGQTVRVLLRVAEDGQTPPAWAGARATVLSRRATMFSKTHSYRLRHPNGMVDSFEENELDQRYARRG